MGTILSLLCLGLRALRILVVMLMSFPSRHCFRHGALLQFEESPLFKTLVTGGDTLIDGQKSFVIIDHPPGSS